MKNRHSQPNLIIPKRCAQCGGLNVPDISWEYGKIVNSYRCVSCGLTGESNSFYDAIKQERVEIRP